MRPLARFAALLALLALVLTTGGAWAALCAPEPSGRGAAAAAPAEHAHGHPGGHPARTPPAPEDGDRAPACPLMALGGAGSCLGSFVGADLSRRSAAPGPVAHSFAPPTDARDLLLAHPPFHPPEAWPRRPFSAGRTGNPYF